MKKDMIFRSVTGWRHLAGRLLAWLAVIATALFAAAPAAGLEPLPAPTGPVILVVDGAIAVTNAPDGARFDRSMLEALGMTTIRTTTAWTDGVQEFSGVLGRLVLDRVGATGTSVVATALNDYAAPLPMEDFERFDALLALDMNGAPMHVSDKGPIWIVYPRDDRPELRDSRLNERWVWQLKELTVK